MSGWTPGEWEYVNGTVRDSAGNEMCVPLGSSPFGGDLDVCEAELDRRGRLISAAPALADALEWALAHVRASGDPEGFSRKFNKARAALAQAKGGE